MLPLEHLAPMERTNRFQKIFVNIVKLLSNNFAIVLFVDDIQVIIILFYF